MHGYHCDCDYCDFNSGRPLRVQRDSTCSGEVISHPFADVGDAAYTMSRLQEAALAADAEPGYNAGFHVHVDMRRVRTDRHHKALWQYLRWETVLMYLAAGRFPYVRNGMNRTVAEMVRYHMNAHYQLVDAPFYDSRHVPFDPHWCEENLSGEALTELAEELHLVHYDSDRHSNLNIATRHGTWEFRLWNSTRSAWRMELWCLLSAAWADHRFVTELSRRDPREPHADVLMAEALAAAGHSRAAELVVRQKNYADRGVTDLAFTVL